MINTTTVKTIFVAPKHTPKGNRFQTTLNTCKIKDFVWDGPCNHPKIASLDTPHTDTAKLLIYKEKDTFQRLYLEWQST